MIARIVVSLFFLLLCLRPPIAQAADPLRLSVQKTGTIAWELAVAKAFGLDKSANLDLVVSELASTEAGKIALQGGSADIIVSDWLFVARDRAQGGKLTFFPNSTAIGAVMTKSAAIQDVRDLRGKKLGVAGGPLDKSWLLLKAFAMKQGVDLDKAATPVFGAPPLISQKLEQGELDAALQFWTFAVDLESKGFRRAVDLHAVESALGAKSDAVVTGYVFDEAFAKAHPDVLKRFFVMSAKAKELIATSEEAWRIVAARIGASNEATLALYHSRYVEGLPKRSVAADEADAATLFQALRAAGGEKLVGPAASLPAGSFYKPGESAAP